MESDLRGERRSSRGSVMAKIGPDATDLMALAVILLSLVTAAWLLINLFS